MLPWTWVERDASVGDQAVSNQEQAVIVKLTAMASVLAGVPLYPSIRVHSMSGARTMRTVAAPAVFDGSGPELVLSSGAGPLRHVHADEIELVGELSS